MLSWLSANWINVVLIAGIVLACFFVILGMARNRRNGKSACGCDCSSCGCSCCETKK